MTIISLYKNGKAAYTVTAEQVRAVRADERCVGLYDDTGDTMTCIDADGVFIKVVNIHKGASSV